VDIIAQNWAKNRMFWGILKPICLRNPIVVNPLINTGQAQYRQLLMRSA